MLQYFPDFDKKKGNFSSLKGMFTEKIKSERVSKRGVENKVNISVSIYCNVINIAFALQLTLPIFMTSKPQTNHFILGCNTHFSWGVPSYIFSPFEYQVSLWNMSYRRLIRILRGAVRVSLKVLLVKSRYKQENLKYLMLRYSSKENASLCYSLGEKCTNS